MNSILHMVINESDIPLRELLVEKNEQEIAVDTLNHIMRIITLVKPIKTLFMAFDGPAPLVKLKEKKQRTYKKIREDEDRLMNLQQNYNYEAVKQNCINGFSITSGSELMVRMNEYIKFFIAAKLHDDVQWQHLEVTFSGSNTPGEGEHKLMDEIRH